MKVHLMKNIAVIAATLAASGAAHAQSAPVTAQAFDVTPSYSTSTRTECTSTPAASGWFGPALGAILGGGAGSQVGKGSGQAAAAAIGATLGAQAGAAVTNNGNQQTQTCRDIAERTLTGYMLRTTHGDVFVPLSLSERFNLR